MKKIVSVCLAFCMLMGMLIGFSMPVAAASNDAEPVYLQGFLNGTVTATAEQLYGWYVNVAQTKSTGSLVKKTLASGASYEISTPEHMIGLSRLSNGLANIEGVTIPLQKFSGEKIVLTKNIVFNIGDADTWTKDTTGLYAWTPIAHQHKWANADTTRAFCGEFDGQGHYISGLYTNGTWETTEKAGRNTGLFGHCFNANIHDLVVVNSAFCNYLGAYTGQGAALIDKIEGCTVSNIYTDVNLWGEYAFGGIVAYAYDANTDGTAISNCVYAGTMTMLNSTDNTLFGGILGAHEESGTTTDVISNCVFAGKIVLDASVTASSIINSAGIISKGDYDVAIRNCIFAGTVEGTGVGTEALEAFHLIAGGNGTYPELTNCLWDNAKIPSQTSKATYNTPTSNTNNVGVSSLVNYQSSWTGWVTDTNGIPMPATIDTIWDNYKSIDFASLGIPTNEDNNNSGSGSVDPGEDLVDPDFDKYEESQKKETENNDKETDQNDAQATDKQADEHSKGGCGSTVGIGALSILLIATCAGAAVSKKNER